jgi:hypothetical protein
MTWEAHIQPALDHAGNTHTLEDVAAAIADGTAFLFAGERSAIVVEINDYPRRKVLNGWLAGGDLAEIVGVLIPKAEAFAREQGCARCMIGGRPGWERVLAADGWEPMARVIVKELT